LQFFFFNLSLIQFILKSLICSLLLLLANLHCTDMILRKVDITHFTLSLRLLQHFLLVALVVQFLQFSALEANLNHLWLLACFYQFHIGQKVLDCDDAAVLAAEDVVVCELVWVGPAGGGASADDGPPHISRGLPRFLIIDYLWERERLLISSRIERGCCLIIHALCLLGRGFPRVRLAPILIRARHGSFAAPRLQARAGRSRQPFCALVSGNCI
jgi:hypothetical protein